MLNNVQWDLFGLNIIVDVFFTVFVIVAVLPVLLISYTVIKSARKSWARFVRWRFSKYTIVEGNSVQSILDNGKNQGIHTLLVQGRSLGEGMRSHLMHLTMTKKLLRSTLTSKYGLYAWRYLEDFILDNHIIEAPCYFRGRLITDANIQEYVSEMTSKYLPSNQSPWQIHMINCFMNGEDTKAFLIRAHHLLLRQEHLVLADFLPLEYTSSTWACQKSDSPFTNLYTEPSALPLLHQKLTESFSNYWNEFLCDNDPMERPEILKKHIGLFQCLKISIIVFVSTFKKLTRNYGKNRQSLFSVFQDEARKRNFNFLIILDAFLHSLNPIQNMLDFFHWIWYFGVILSLKMPLLFLRELQALKSHQKHHHPDTLTSVLYHYLPLIFQSIIEIISITSVALAATRSIIDELFVKHVQSNLLQTISPCGRKVVAWSDRVDIDLLDRISSVTGASHTDILLAATVDSLKVYFKETGQNIPREVFATARYVSQRALFAKNHEIRGIMCLALPTKTPLFDDDLVEILQVIRKNVKEARARQCAIYALTAAENFRQILTSLLPSILVKIILNHLTRRYSLSLTHVDGDILVENVTTAIYWNPPQGNCNLSITLHRHGSGVRLGVMGDAMISPQHIVITRAFPSSLENLAIILGVPGASSRISSPDSLCPTTPPGY